MNSQPFKATWPLISAFSVISVISLIRLMLSAISASCNDGKYLWTDEDYSNTTLKLLVIYSATPHHNNSRIKISDHVVQCAAKIIRYLY